MNIFEENERGYQTTHKKANCLHGGIISNMNECVTASIQLKRKYVGRTTSNIRPAGCYWYNKQHTYFNTIIDLSNTRPNKFGNRGGICIKSST